MNELRTKSLMLLNKPFFWQIFDVNGMPITDPFGNMKPNEDLDYVFARAMQFRSKIPKHGISIQFKKEKFVISVGSPHDIKGVLNDTDVVAKKIDDPPDLEIPYQVFDYDNNLFKSNGQLPSDLDTGLLLYEAFNIDKHLKSKEIFMGNNGVHTYLGVCAAKKPLSIIISAGEETILAGIVEADYLAVLLYLIEKYHPLIEKGLDMLDDEL